MSSTGNPNVSESLNASSPDTTPACARPFASSNWTIPCRNVAANRSSSEATTFSMNAWFSRSSG